MASKNIASVGADCVACGSCAAVCPRGAITVPSGIKAVVDPALCVGCGTCARECPAAIISIVPREADYD
jgi:ferredoxin